MKRFKGTAITADKEGELMLVSEHEAIVEKSNSSLLMLNYMLTLAVSALKENAEWHESISKKAANSPELGGIAVRSTHAALTEIGRTWEEMAGDERDGKKNNTPA
jgi:hypothetical protein